MKKQTIFTGHYGSGKTEVAINYALKNKAQAIVDLDIVNPYFRTHDVKTELESAGIQVVAPNFANTNLDLPSLPPEIYAVLSQKAPVVIDVGGDDDGAIALGRYKQYFKDGEYNMFFVINVFRPMTEREEDIIEMIRAVEAASRLKVTGLINNSNLLSLTTREHIDKGEKTVFAVSEKTGIPFLFSSAIQSLAKDGELPLEQKIIMP